MTGALNLVFAGSSFSVYGTTQYNNLVRQWAQPTYDGSYTTLARNGNNTWSNLVRLDGALTADVQTVIIDTANDDNNTMDKAALEAFIRRTWTYNPNIKIVGVSAPSWNAQDTSNNAIVSTPTNLTAVNNAKAIFDYYSTSYAAYLDAVIALVNAGTRDLDEMTTDTVHPSSAYGYPLMAELVEAFLPNGGAQLSGSLPDYLLADAADFVHTPQIINGTDYDSRTGTWADNGTSTSSSEVDATITFNVTCRSFGLYRSDNEAGNNGNIEVDIDGGGYNAITADRNGYDIGARAAYTITIKVTGGTVRIDEFWAI